MIKSWSYPVNTVVKFVSKESIKIELCSKSEEFRNKFMDELLNEKKLGEQQLISNYSEYLDIIGKIQS